MITCQAYDGVEERTVIEPLPEIDVEGLSVPQKLELIGRLWDSIPDSVEALPVLEWHREEVERRLESADASPELGIPWEQVRTRLRGKR